MDVIIISSHLVETPTNRGAGIQEQHYRIGLELSKYFHIVVASPFYRRYNGSVSVNRRFEIEEVYFPAVKNYPVKSTLERYMDPLLSVFYSFLVSVKIVNLLKKRARIVVVTKSLEGLLPAFLAKLFRAKVIFSEGSLWPWASPYLIPKKLSISQKIMYSMSTLSGTLLGKLSNFVRVQSISIKKGMIKNGVDPNKIEVIGPAIDTDMFKPVHDNSPSYKKFRVGFVGRLMDEKGAPLLFELCEKAEKSIPNVSFMIIGGGAYEEKFKSLKNVEHIGWLPRNMLPASLSQVQAILFFQRDLGVAELEAMALGKAIIASKRGEVTHVIKHLENGILCEPVASSYVNAIKTLTKSPSLLYRLSCNARETALKFFSWDSIGHQWLQVICREIK